MAHETSLVYAQAEAKAGAQRKGTSSSPAVSAAVSASVSRPRDSPSVRGSHTTHLTRKVRDALASVRREPLAHCLEGRPQPRLHAELEPGTPPGSEAGPRLIRTPSPVSSGTTYGTPPAWPQASPASQARDTDTSSEQWHTPPEELYSSAGFQDGSSAIDESAFATPATGQASSGQPSSGSGAGLEAGLPSPDFSGSAESQLAALERALQDVVMASSADETSDGDVSMDGDIEDWGSSKAFQGPVPHVPACAEEPAVRLQLVVQERPSASLQQRHVRAQLFVTESHGGVKYVAVDSDPDAQRAEQTLHPLSLEWLRDVPVVRARQYLMDVAGTPSLRSALSACLYRSLR